MEHATTRAATPRAHPGAARAQRLQGRAGDVAVRVLKAMAHRERLVILCLLMDGELCVRDLERGVGMRQAALSQQLARLRAENIVEADRLGRFMLYRIKSPQILAVVRALCSKLAD
ncbi:MAG: helix-turn-helix transcriptional regulator [Betaproteobacteria bacterium]|nr:helix-turn-helix transcriptional regulator [Betaproteobacteria bacterium]MDE2124057.1 helix-turn-helix transcriptional regulator [Betaproteobacteria bacterium]MDE2185820.1 helix-turn-helix transcriptional regulator [Betaproteobacteria bacterium]MDE2325526.1 helix-turn-helix transcriptional regulator [Betaproteobacteria bacterium]